MSTSQDDDRGVHKNDPKDPEDLSAPLSPAQPSDPYNSFLVKASAGSGKTHQLADRFLKLCSAGADPCAILTLTFTLKAAAEMKARILSRCSMLLRDTSQAQIFDQQMNRYYTQTQSRGLNQIQPLSAQHTATKILSVRSSLAIMTIDSLFYKWAEEYGSHPQTDTPLKMASQAEIHQLRLQVWESFFDWPWKREGVTPIERGGFEPLFELAKGQWPRLERIKKLIVSLTHYAAKIAYDQLNPDHHHDHPFVFIENLYEDTVCRMAQHLEVTSQRPSEISKITDRFVQTLSHKIRTLINQAGKQQLLSPLLSSLHDQMSEPNMTDWLGEARKGGFMTHKGMVSKNAIRGSLRDQQDLHEMIAEIEVMVGLFCDNRLYKLITSSFKQLFLIYQQADERLERLKHHFNLCTYDDNAIYVYQMFGHDSKAKQAIWARTDHLMIDELQDTSVIQWDIFKRMSLNLFQKSASPSSPLTPSVFMVGDPKQCLYAFRQAVPYVVDAASELMKQYDHDVVELGSNYRSYQSVCDYVSRVFSHLELRDFRPAMSECAARFDHGEYTSIEALNFNCLRPDGQPLLQLSMFEMMQKEAQTLARHLRTILEHASDYLVCDDGRCRAIQAADMAILYRNSTHAQIFETALHYEGIEVTRSEKTGFFDRLEVKDCMHLLNLCVYPSDRLSLVAVASSPIGGVDQTAILEFLESTDEHQIPVMDSLFMGWFQHFALYPSMVKIGEFIRQTDHSQFASLFCSLLTDLDVDVIYSQMYHQQGCGGETEQAAVYVAQFMELVCQLSPQFESKAAILSRLHLLKQDKMDSHVGSPGVSMMTIHQAKGLEFPMVCLTQSCVSWISSQSDDFYTRPHESDPMHSDLIPGRLMFKQDLIFKDRVSGYNGLHQNQQIRLYHESLRLLYVSLTRASQYLLISGPKEDHLCMPTPRLSSPPSPRQQAVFWPTLKSCVADSPSACERTFQDYEVISSVSADLKAHRDTKHPSLSWDHEKPSIPSLKSFGMTADEFGQQIQAMQNHSVGAQGFVSSQSFDDQTHVFSGRGTQDQKRLIFRGQYIHKCLEISLRHRRWCKLDTYQLPWIEGELDQSFMTEIETEAYRSYQWLMKKISSHKYDCEVWLCRQKNNQLVFGKADLVIYNDDVVEIIDFKTKTDGSQNHVDESYVRQLSLYKYCLESNTDKPIVCHILFTHTLEWVTVECDSLSEV